MYREHQQTIEALISHLGLVKYKSRTVPYIEKAIGLEESDARHVLTTYRGIFRESSEVDEHNEHYFTLQIRYAMRSDQYKKSHTSNEGTPLDVSHVMHLIEIVGQNAAREQERHLAQDQLTTEREMARQVLKQDGRSLEQKMRFAQQELEQQFNLAQLDMCAARDAAKTATTSSIVAAAAAILAALISALF